MKKTIKTLIILAIIMIFSINYYNVNASFADFTDEDAKSLTEKMEQEQEQNFNELKSSNNYLSNLKIDGYELTPKFDKQILEYNLNNKTDLKELNIEAIADDEKAKIEGNGKIVLKENQNECRIDVIAESGTVRTYIIKLNQEKETESSNTDTNIISDEEQQINTIIKNGMIKEDINKNNKENDKKSTIIFIGIFIIALVIVFICRKLIRKKNSKH